MNKPDFGEDLPEPSGIRPKDISPKAIKRMVKIINKNKKLMDKEKTKEQINKLI